MKNKPRKKVARVKIIHTNTRVTHKFDIFGFKNKIKKCLEGKSTHTRTHTDFVRYCTSYNSVLV